MSEFSNPSLKVVSANAVSSWFDDDLAARYFTAIQDKHVPITAKLALELAQMTRTGVPSDSPIWGRGFLFAGHAIGMADRLGNSIAWRNTLEGFIHSVVEPVLRKSSAHLNMAMVVARDNSWLNVNYDNEYKSYVEKLESLVDKLLSEPNEMGHNFWASVGISLITHLRNKLTRQEYGTLPFIDNLAVSMFYEIEPDFSNIENQNLKRIKKTVSSQYRRFAIKPREGGVEGVIHSRRLEELGEALPSSLIAPKEYRVLKLIEEGFFLTNRPPYRRPMRDVLIIVFCEESPISESLQLARSAWLDASIRLLAILKDIGMSRTELVLCDCKKDGIYSSALSAEKDAIRAKVDPFMISGKIRAQLMTQSTLCPGVFQTTSKQQYSDIESAKLNLMREGTIGSEALNEAVASALLNAAAVQPRDKLANIEFNRESADFLHYTKVLTISLRPDYVNVDEQRIPDAASEDRVFKSALSCDSTENISTAFVYLPKILDKDSVFNLNGVTEGSMEQINPINADDPKTCFAKLTAELSLWFIKQVLEVVDG